MSSTKLWKTKILKIGRFLIIFLIIAGWIFSGWPQIWQNPRIPPKTNTAQALNQVNNWAFATSTAYFTTSNVGTGTDICGSNTSATAGTAMATFAWSAGKLTGTSGMASATNYKAFATQRLIVPAGGAWVSGQFAWSTPSGSWNTGTASSTYVRLDIYDVSNSTFIANLGCAGAVSAIDAATSTFSSAVFLPAATYTIDVTLTALQKSGSGRSAITVTADNINVNQSPEGLSASAPNASTTVSLAWTASTAGVDQVPTLNSNGYKIYRSTSAAINTSTNNIASPTGTGTTYTDNNAQANTTYYYAVSDIDTTSVESPVSATSTILTNPGVPGTPTFSSIGSTSLTVSWTAPPNGSSNYNIWRCTGGNCGGTPSNFSPIATTSVATFGDTVLTSGTTYDYEIRALNTNNSYGNFSSYGQATTTSASLTLTIDTSSVSFVSAITPGTPVSTSSVLTVNTNNATGYNIKINRASTTPTLILSADNATTISDTPNGSNWTAPAATSTAGPSAVWTSGTTQGLGFRVKQTGTVSNTYSSTWWGTSDNAANALYSGISTSTALQMIANTTLGSATNENTVVEYKLDTAATQKSGQYVSSPVVFTATPNP